MRRKIEMKNGRLYFKGSYIGEPTTSTRHAFGLTSNGFYNITITEGTMFRATIDPSFYNIYVGDRGYKFVGSMCRNAFEQIFFKLEPKQTYDVIVKKVK